MSAHAANQSRGKLYLIPTWLGPQDVQHILPSQVVDISHQLAYFIVENEKTARHFLSVLGYPKPIRTIQFFTLDQHTQADEIASMIQPMLLGHDVGLLSEAGCPAVADPGATVVRAAHEHHIPVMPLVGPSSILLGLMASGLNGQQFCFCGYLPAEKQARIDKIKQLELESKQKQQTQIFIETPYRNDYLFQDLIAHCKPETQVCVAKNISLNDQWILTQSVQQWRSSPIPELDKQATLFLMLA